MAVCLAVRGAVHQRRMCYLVNRQVSQAFGGSSTGPLVRARQEAQVEFRYDSEPKATPDFVINSFFTLQTAKRSEGLLCPASNVEKGRSGEL